MLCVFFARILRICYTSSLRMMCVFLAYVTHHPCVWYISVFFTHVVCMIYAFFAYVSVMHNPCVWYAYSSCMLCVFFAYSSHTLRIILAYNMRILCICCASSLRMICVFFVYVMPWLRVSSRTCMLHMFFTHVMRKCPQTGGGGWIPILELFYKIFLRCTFEMLIRTLIYISPKILVEHGVSIKYLLLLTLIMSFLEAMWRPWICWITK